MINVHLLKFASPDLRRRRTDLIVVHHGEMISYVTYKEMQSCVIQIIIAMQTIFKSLILVQNQQRFLIGLSSLANAKTSSRLCTQPFVGFDSKVKVFNF